MEPEIETEEVSSVTTVSAGTSYGEKGEDGKYPQVKASLEFNVGADLQAAAELYGEDIVYERYRRGAIKDCGNAIRSSLNKHVALAEKDGGEVDVAAVAQAVQNELGNWRLDVSRRKVGTKKDPVADFMAAFGDMTEERRAEIIAQLQG